MVQIDHALNLVVPIRDDDVKVQAFHAPISRDVFEANYALLAHVQAKIAEEGIYYQMGLGPRVAAMLLRDRARELAAAHGDVDGEGKPSERLADALFAELKRLTTILAPGANGWDMVPVDAAISRKVIDADEWEEILSQLVYFTSHFALARKAEKKKVAAATASILRASVTSSSLTEYAHSLPTSTMAATSPAPAASSVPS